MTDRTKATGMAAGRAKAQRQLAGKPGPRPADNPEGPPPTTSGTAAGRAKAEKFLAQPGNNFNLTRTTTR
ncbi:hypothetical protein [Kocuria sp. CNJ-770]|uniref:hypothetical protein n=1 Tax=Kocuria sp. CNJ-770 TaxID=1904964 RepID=UPI001115317B|nr:hypothetical protein [Kocuria sp. CNJ-770]